MAGSSSNIQVRVPDSEEEMAIYARATAIAFGATEERARETIQRRPLEGFRVVHLDGRPVGGAYVHDMGQYFGGRRVSCAGIGGVAVMPEARGHGAGAELMRSIVAETSASQTALSALFPASQPVYRKVGYEQAAGYARHKVATASLGSDERKELGQNVTVEEISGVDRLETLKALYFSDARRTDGHLDRSEDIWRRLVDPVGPKAPRVYLFTEHEAPTGYLVLDQMGTGGFTYDLDIKDMVTTTRGTLAAALTFLAGHQSLARNVILPAVGRHVAFLVPPEQRWSVVEDWRMMMRLTHIPSAIEQRGFPRGLSAHVDIEVDDPVLPDNGGRWRIALDDGRATAERGGDGTVALHVRALAALYGGAADVADLCAANLCRAPTSAVDAVRVVFHGPMASVRDFF